MTLYEKTLQNNINISKTALENKGMKINTNKTKIIVISNEVTIDNVRNIKYLVGILDKTGQCETEINNRIPTTIGYIMS